MLLAYSTSHIAFMVGNVILIVGLFGRRLTRAPRCRKCAYDVSGLNVGDACSECGERVRSVRAVVRRRPRWLVVLLGVVVMSASAFPILRNRAAGFTSPEHWPTILLINSMENTPREADRNEYIRILTERLLVGDVSDPHAAELAARFLEWHADPDQIWNPSCGEFIEVAHRRGLIDDARFAEYLVGSRPLTVIAVRAVIGEPPCLEMEIGLRAGAADCLYIFEHLGTTIDGQPHWTDVEQIAIDTAMAEGVWRPTNFLWLSRSSQTPVNRETLPEVIGSRFIPTEPDVYEGVSTWRCYRFDSAHDNVEMVRRVLHGMPDVNGTRQVAFYFPSPRITQTDNRIEKIREALGELPAAYVVSTPFEVRVEQSSDLATHDDPETGARLRDYLWDVVLDPYAFSTSHALSDPIRGDALPLLGVCDYHFDVYQMGQKEPVYLGSIWQSSEIHTSAPPGGRPEDVLYAVDRHSTVNPNILSNRGIRRAGRRADLLLRANTFIPAIKAGPTPVWAEDITLIDVPVR